MSECVPAGVMVDDKPFTRLLLPKYNAECGEGRKVRGMGKEGPEFGLECQVIYGSNQHHSLLQYNATKASHAGQVS